MTIKEIAKQLIESRDKNCNIVFCEKRNNTKELYQRLWNVYQDMTTAINSLRDYQNEAIIGNYLGREECWSNNIRVNIPVPDESGVGLDNTWSVDKYYIIGTLKEQFLDCDIVFVSCGENRGGAVTYNVDIEVCQAFDQSCTIEQNEMAVDHDLKEFCKAHDWLVITK